MESDTTDNRTRLHTNQRRCENLITDAIVIAGHRKLAEFSLPC